MPLAGVLKVALGGTAAIVHQRFVERGVGARLPRNLR